MDQLCSDARSYVLSVTRRILRCEDAAADATQEAMLLAHRHRDKFRGDSAYRTWLHRIAVTTALQHLRRKKRSREDLVLEAPDTPTFDPQCSSPSPEHVVAVRQLAERARDLLDALDDKHRHVFDLRASDHTETEIAERLDISVANVKIRAHRTRKKLRDSLHHLYAIDGDLALSA
jgi:RNA polymerase sigma-70 factor (ECF subfamily)